MESKLPSRATLAQIAQAAGLTERTVRRHAKEAAVERGEDRLYPSREVLAAIVEHRDRDKNAAASSPAVAKARAEKIRLESELLKVRLMREKRELVLAAEVKLAWQSMAGTMRARLLGLPQGAAPMVARETDAAECARILDEMIREALEELAGDGLPSSADELLAEAEKMNAKAEPAPKPAKPKAKRKSMTGKKAKR